MCRSLSAHCAARGSDSVRSTQDQASWPPCRMVTAMLDSDRNAGWPPPCRMIADGPVREAWTEPSYRPPSTALSCQRRSTRRDSNDNVEKIAMPSSEIKASAANIRGMLSR